MHMGDTETLHTNIAAVLFGCGGTVFLFGFLCCQTHTFFNVFDGRKDRLNKVVFIIWLMELGHTVAICYTFTHLVLRPITLESLDQLIGVKSIPPMLFFGTLSDSIVRVVYVQRIRKFGFAAHLRHTNYIVASCATFVVLILVVGLVTSVLIIPATSFKAFTAEKTWILIMMTPILVGGDLSIAISLCYLLKASISEKKSTIKIINRLIEWTIETSLLTSVGAVVDMLCLILFRNNLFYIGVYMILPKLYSNSLLALLNARVTLRNTSPEPMAELKFATNVETQAVSHSVPDLMDEATTNLGSG